MNIVFAARWTSVAALAVFSAIATAQPAPIKIGSFLSISGQGSFLGDPSKKTLELYVDDINKKGGVLGRKLQLITYDTGTNAKDAVTYVKRLIEQDGVDIIIGGNTTGETLAIAPLVQQARIPLISLAGGTPVIEPVKEWIFKSPQTDRLAVERLLQHVQEGKLTTLGVLTGSGGFDKSCRSELLKLAPKYQVAVISDETHGPGDSDMTAQLTKIRSSGAQAFVYCGFGTPTSIVAKNHKQLNLSMPMYQTHGSASQQFIDGAAGGAEGALVTASAVLFADQLADADPQKAVTLSLIRAYRERYGQDADVYVGYAHDALLIAVTAIQRAGGIDREKVRASIESIKGLVGTSGIYNLSAQDHMGLAPNSFRMVTVKSGRFSLVR